MQLKNLFVSLVAFGSAVVIATPAAGHDAGSIDARAAKCNKPKAMIAGECVYPPDCGNSASWNYNQATCVCTVTEQTYDDVLQTCACPVGKTPSGKKCKDICPKSTTYVPAENGNEETCSCNSPEYKWNTRSHSCELKCDKKIAYWDGPSEACKCNNHRHVFSNGACACPAGTIPSGKECNPECKTGATWQKKENACVCKAKNTVYKETGCECKTGHQLYQGSCMPTCKAGDNIPKKVCICDESKDFKKINNICTPVCEAGDKIATKKCYCDLTSANTLWEKVEGRCVKKCTVTNQVHDLTHADLKCHCDVSENKFYAVDEQTCSPVCEAGETVSTKNCYCDGSDNSDWEKVEGRCVKKCTVTNQVHDLTHADLQCHCDTENNYYESEDHETCSPICEAGELVSTKDCYCDESADSDWEKVEGRCVKKCTVTNQVHDLEHDDLECHCPAPEYHAVDEDTCTAVCEAGDDVAATHCYCDESDGSEWEKVEGRCVKKCTVPNQVHDLEHDDLECHCPAPEYHAVDEETCTAVCEAGDDVAATHCYCDETDGSEWEKVEGRCVKKCTVPNQVHDLEDANLKCHCPSPNFYAVSDTKCLPLCTKDQLTKENGNDKCYCKTQGTKFVEKNDYCVEKCDTPEELNNASPPVCHCPAPFVKDSNKCLPKCADGDKFKNTATECFCDTTTLFDKVGDFCKDKCFHKSSRNNKGQCVCQGLGAFYKNNMCKCPKVGKYELQYRNNACQALACPDLKLVSSLRTRFDEENATCVCVKANGQDDTSKTWNEKKYKCE